MTDTGDARERLQVSRVLAQTFGLIGRNFLAFFLLSLLFAGIPNGIVTYAQLATLGTGGAQIWWVSLGGVLVVTASAFVLQGALTQASIGDLTRKRVSIGAALATGFRLLIPLLALGLLVAIGAIFGFLLLIVPGLILIVRWIVSAPILVVEQHAPT